MPEKLVVQAHNCPPPPRPPLNLFKERSTVFFHCRFPFLLFTGPYTIILGSPAKVEDVIQYADFSNRISPVRLADKSTVDLEPDVEELKGLLDGSLKLNNSDLHVLTSGKISISSNSESLGLVFWFVLASRLVCASFFQWQVELSRKRHAGISQHFTVDPYL